MLAQEEARRLGHNFVGTEQILLGLIGESTGIAAKVLKSMGVNLKDARVEVEKIIGAGQLACPLEKKHLASLCNTALLSSFKVDMLLCQQSPRTSRVDNMLLMLCFCNRPWQWLRGCGDSLHTSRQEGAGAVPGRGTATR